VANALNENLTGRYVIVREDRFDPKYRDIKNRVFLVRGGFGSVPFTSGSALFGTTPIDGEKFRIEGGDVERFATDEEIEAVTKTRWFINEEGTVYEHHEATQRDAFPNDDHVPYVTQAAAEAAAEALFSSPPVFHFLVTVTAETRELAEQVMNERVNHDENLGFEYTIDWGAAP
jgi:hypothetical protein